MRKNNILLVFFCLLILLLAGSVFFLVARNTALGKRITELTNEHKELEKKIQDLTNNKLVLEVKNLEQKTKIKELEEGVSARRQGRSGLNVSRVSPRERGTSGWTLDVTPHSKKEETSPDLSGEIAYIVLGVGDKLPSFTNDDIDVKNSIHWDTSVTIRNGVRDQKNIMVFQKGSEIKLKNGAHYISQEHCEIHDFTIISGSIFAYNPE